MKEGCGVFCCRAPSDFFVKLCAFASFPVAASHAKHAARNMQAISNALEYIDFLAWRPRLM